MRIRSIVLGTTLLLGLAMLSGCAANSDQLQQLNQNQFTLRGMIASDRQDIAALRQQMRSLQGEIAQLKHSGAGAGGASSQQLSNLDQRVTRLESEVGAIQAAIPTIPTAPGTTGGTAAPGAGTTPATGAAAAAANNGLKPTWPSELQQELTDAKDKHEPGMTLFRSALIDMQNGHYPPAVIKFARFQRKYPKSQLSEASEYFAANALFEEGNYDRSILQFNDVVMRFPNGQYTSQSLLREAQAFMKLNDKIDARLTLQKLLANHPGTPQAKAANTLMQQLTSSE